MRKAVKLLILGGVVGGVVVAVKSLRSEETVDDMPVKAAKTAGVCALVGGVIGFVLDRRSKGRESRKSRLARALPKRADLPHIDLPHIDLPHIDLPRIELPSIDLPDLRKATRRARKSAGKAARRATKRASAVADLGREKLAS